MRRCHSDGGPSACTGVNGSAFRVDRPLLRASLRYAGTPLQKLVVETGLPADERDVVSVDKEMGHFRLRLERITVGHEERGFLTDFERSDIVIHTEDACRADRHSA